MEPPELIINKYEVVIFPKDFITSDFNKLLEEIKEKVTVFDGINIVLPLPNDTPTSIPRILLRSKENDIVCTLSLEKIDINWVNTKELKTYKKTLNEIQDVVEKLTNVLFNHTVSKEIKRIGYIKEIYYETITPIKDISNKMLVSEATSYLSNFRLQLTYSLDLLEKDCNDVITLAKGQTTIGKKPVLLLTEDINTKPDNEINWDTIKIKEFIKEASKKSKSEDLYNRFFKQK